MESIPIEKIIAPYNTRLAIDDETVERYMRDIEAEGLLHPISVFREDGKGLYAIATGRHRYEAIKKLSIVDKRWKRLKIYSEIKILNEDPSYPRALELSNMENNQLAPTPADLGFQYVTLIEQNNYTKEKISAERHVTISQIEHDIDIFKKLLEINPKIISDMRNKRINRNQLGVIIKAGTIAKQQELYAQALKGKTGDQLAVMLRLWNLPTANDRPLNDILDAVQKARTCAVKMTVNIQKEKEFLEKDRSHPSLSSAIRSYLKTGSPVIPKNVFVDER